MRNVPQTPLIYAILVLIAFLTFYLLYDASALGGRGGCTSGSSSPGGGYTPTQRLYWQHETNNNTNTSTCAASGTCASAPLVLAVGLSGGPRSMMITAGRIHDNVLRALVGCFPAALGDPCPALANVDVFLDLNKENDCDANPHNVWNVESCSRAHEASVANMTAILGELSAGDPSFPVALLTSVTGAAVRPVLPRHNATLVAVEESPLTCHQQGQGLWNALWGPSSVPPFLQGDVCCRKHPNALSHNLDKGGLWGFGQYARRRRLIQLILRHEPARLALRGLGAQQGPTYAAVVLIRPDYFIFRPLPPLPSIQRTNPDEVLFSSKERGGGLGDYLYLVPRSRLDDMDWALTATFSKRCERNTLGGIPEAEMEKLLLERGVPFVRFQFYGAIVASPKYNSCGRLDTAVLEGSHVELHAQGPLGTGPPPPRPRFRIGSAVDACNTLVAAEFNRKYLGH